jgi:hypothetical protein
VGRVRLPLVDVRSGSVITLEANPDTSVDELVRMLKERGVVQPAEAVMFGKVERDGTLEPLNPSTVRDLLAVIASGGRVAFEARRIQGGKSECLQILLEVAESFGLKFEGEVAYGFFKWRGSDETYTVYIKCPDVPGFPPVIIIRPYPYYVKIFDEFEENHARSCCMEQKIGDAVCGYWHIDPEEYRKFLQEVKNPKIAFYFIINSLIQALQLHKAPQNV